MKCMSYKNTSHWWHNLTVAVVCFLKKETDQNSLEECATVDAEVKPGPVTQIPCFPHTDRPDSPSCLCDHAKSGHYSLEDCTRGRGVSDCLSSLWWTYNFTAILRYCVGPTMHLFTAWSNVITYYAFNNKAHILSICAQRHARTTRSF